MTTTVTVKACCTPPTEVEVVCKRGDRVVEHSRLENGEEKMFYAYDDRVISVREFTPEKEPTE